MGIGTQNGLAAYLSLLTANDLPLEYLRDFPRQIERLTAEQVHEAAIEFLSPKNMATVLVGDGARITRAVEAVDDVEVRAHTE
jgi:predicted Zn-dependent peptidase